MLKKILAFIISAIPCNLFRIIFYRIILKYQISFSSRIGLFTVIAVDEATIIDAKIGKFNKFVGPYRLEIDEGSFIGYKNNFNCGEWVVNFPDSQYLRTCKIGKKTLITNFHFIDTSGGFELNENSWLAGKSSEFWTHGAGAVDRAISIGKDCYIGSGVKLAPGVVIGNNNLIGLGSVLTQNFNVENALIAGNPAKVIRENYFWQKGAWGKDYRHDS
ncbi:MAG TPA: hypothetical protein DEG17_12980 [Cyanobacteria bacterium UBA11149]|nr:hypothetical protein [Cyanobacteria bacterium UBA11367]HBE60944.1 hypothetical protein [Cyanobacteria bacterium UBA11366]HBK62447.1 hypothetical protein [Cyanobacteria bacterium UBA11166]HBR76406.1 hypothetical protein [Cyanobacteria bacterium UBA11159]HBS72061.1 hypothetical protein [Cyanobacteria bacterium UBA11153]HBW89756.1 hypothetical protein [Cyanobacteria bacterium UBA11149]HCA95474.1 hypothetical protein [Cyanobacteria bacterium UBA9226]